ncbi:methylmalonyl-CoA epimerase [Nakamurella aerolata]|uniref:Methylmalonyl-CoA epimerase n=1 Tax=Nakamurella aerolata TaxID=1656892 RepID=A0A849A637_9ACTN|nr:methylmalonyl-CoA epimerase [Nakamurella aerolata]NNG34568.1 methylmalonyl-CoA epimerase [Nakamurella aerolata]
MTVSQTLRALEVAAVDHVGLAVPELDAAIAFHTDVLGGRLTHRETNPEQQVEEAMIAFGPADSPHSTQLQLLAPTGPDSTIAKFIDRQGPGLQQLAVRVPDVAAAAAALRARGLRLLYDQPRGGTAGSLINFVHPKDAGGVLLELVQPAAEDGQHAADQGRQTDTQREGAR